MGSRPEPSAAEIRSNLRWALIIPFGSAGGMAGLSLMVFLTQPFPRTATTLVVLSMFTAFPLGVALGAHLTCLSEPKNKR